MTSNEIAVARRLLPQLFPRLHQTQFEITSPRTIEYNCIAWAADDPHNWWWPGGKYWPGGVTPDDSLVSFTAAFAMLGYSICPSPEIEIGVTKVALYANALGSVTHAARQLENGMWSSKPGTSMGYQSRARSCVWAPSSLW